MSDSGPTPWANPGGGSGEDAPPPPPPPEAFGGWSPIERPGATSSGPWQPPPRPSRSVGPIVIGVLGVLLLLVGLGAVGLLTVRSESGSETGGPTEFATEAPTPDSERDSQLAAILTTIDAAERRMIAFQEAAFLALETDPEGFGDDVSAEAGDAAGDLSELHEDLVLHARDGGDELQGLRVIRDTYRVHLEAWIAYTEAVADDPVLVRPDNPDAEPYWDDIATTADEFVRGVETGMPPDAPSELRDRAEFILDRGFRGGDDPGELV